MLITLSFSGRKGESGGREGESSERESSERDGEEKSVSNQISLICRGF